jgi:anaerobic magnesium-protoporphyrin IX monomethyl ester cyclase
MRFERVFLVALASYSQPNRPNAPNVGLGYIAEVAARAGIEYDVLDMLLGYRVDQLKTRIHTFKPDLIGFSMMTAHYKRNYELIREVKRTFPDIPVVLGGAHASTFREQILVESPEIDFVIDLEGENTFLELCQGHDRREILGLIHRCDGRVVHNGERPFRKNLDEIPFPTYRKFEMKKYSQPDINLSTSRGCPYSCIFCTVSTVAGKKVRVRSPKNVVDEIEYWVGQGHTSFLIADDNFTFYKDRVMTICDEIEKRHLPNLEFRAHNGIRADKVDYELLKRMKEVGFDYVQISAEGGNDKILKNMKKGESMEALKTAIENACAVGMEVQVAFVIGTPGETWQDLEDSFALASQYPVWRADWNHLYAYPDTELFEWAKKGKHFITAPEQYLNQDPDYKNVPVMETPELTRAERIRASEVFKRINKGLLRKAAARKLHRYAVLGKVIAFIFSTDWFQHVWHSNRTFRTLADKARRALS